MGTIALGYRLRLYLPVPEDSESVSVILAPDRTAVKVAFQ